MMPSILGWMFIRPGAPSLRVVQGWGLSLLYFLVSPLALPVGGRAPLPARACGEASHPLQARIARPLGLRKRPDQLEQLVSLP
jgi:hypothetical protein